MRNGFLAFFLAIIVSPKLLAFNFLPSTFQGEIVHHQYFSLSYVEHHEVAEWTAHVLTRESINSSQPRTDDFREDPSITTGSATLSDYKGSGYDRGHLVPAGDMKLNRTAMSETFYLSNIAPQTASMNRGIWKRIESSVRSIAQNEGQLYVITGPVFGANSSTIGQSKVTIPPYFYKIIFKFDGTKSKMMAFLVANQASNAQIDDHLVSVDYLEEITQIDFFPELEDSIEEKLESKSQPWPQLYL